jgi:UDP-galactopyranose mutase
MNLTSNIDLLIVGAGPVGCTIAERASTIKGWRSVIIDRRDHIGGNCHDCTNEHGQLIHKYGPHYFRTNHEGVLDYLSKFTDWIPGNYVVKSSVNGSLYPFPINLTTLEKFFQKSFTESEAKNFLNNLSMEFESPSNSEEFILSKLGKDLYESFYLGYTKKQWDLHPRDLSPSVCGRIPIRFDRSESYVNAKHQCIPKDGYTSLFSKMITSQNIQFLGNTDFNSIKQSIHPKVATIYTGPIDEYFDCCYGKLPWRSLTFEWKTFDEQFVQPCVQINFPNDNLYTRSVEIKHVTKQSSDTTTISYEFPKSEGDPFYPIPNNSSSSLYEKYRILAQKETEDSKVFFVGRLAEFTYINTDEAILKGLQTFDKISILNDTP